MQHRCWNVKILEVGIWELLNFLTWNTSSEIVLKRSYLNYLHTERPHVCWWTVRFLLEGSVQWIRKALLFEYRDETAMILHCRSTEFFLQSHLCNVFFQEMETCTWTSQQNPTAIPCWMPLNRLCMSGLQNIMAVSVPSTDWASRKSSSFSTANPARQSF